MNMFKLLNVLWPSMIKVMGVLSKAAYSANKNDIKKIFKDCGLAFNSQEYNQNDRFIWSDKDTIIEAKYTKTQVKIVITADEHYAFVDEIREIVKEKGGKWKIVPPEKLKENEKLMLKQELKGYDRKKLYEIENEQRNAMRQGHKICPILKPMIKQYLEIRKATYDVENEHTPDSLFDEIIEKTKTEVDDAFF